MNEERYILKMTWQSKTGVQGVLYLGCNELGKMDCVPDKDKAKRMTKEDCEGWLLILANGNRWSIEEVEVTETQNTNETEIEIETTEIAEEIIKETPEVNNDDTSN